MSHVDSCSDNEMNLIALHQKPHYLVGRPLAQPDTVIVYLQYLTYFLKGKDAFGNKVDAFNKTFGRQLGVLKDQLINNRLIEFPGNDIGSCSPGNNNLSPVIPDLGSKIPVFFLFIGRTGAEKQFPRLTKIYGGA